LLPKREKLFDSAGASQVRPTDHTPWLTTQYRSPTLCRPPHSAAHGDKDQCDEKQRQQHACTPFLSEMLTPSPPHNQLNVGTAIPLHGPALQGRRAMAFCRADDVFDRVATEPVARPGRMVAALNELAETHRSEKRPVEYAVRRHIIVAFVSPN